MWYLFTYHFIRLQQLLLPIPWTQRNYMLQIWILGGSILHTVATVGTGGGGRGGGGYKRGEGREVDDGSLDRDSNGDRYIHGEREDVGNDVATGPVPLEWCVGADTGGLPRGTYGGITHLTVSGPNPQGGGGGSVA